MNAQAFSLQLKSLLEKEATLDELLQAIVEEYLLKGMEAGEHNEFLLFFPLGWLLKIHFLEEGFRKIM